MPILAARKTARASTEFGGRIQYDTLCALPSALGLAFAAGASAAAEFGATAVARGDFRGGGCGGLRWDFGAWRLVGRDMKTPQEHLAEINRCADFALRFARNWAKAGNTFFVTEFIRRRNSGALAVARDYEGGCLRPLQQSAKSARGWARLAAKAARAARRGENVFEQRDKAIDFALNCASIAGYATEQQNQCYAVLRRMEKIS